VRRLLGDSTPGDALAGARGTLHAIYAAEPSAAAHLPALEELDTFGDAAGNRTGSGFIVDSFWSAWDAFAGVGDHADTIERAIRYGHDTGTTAAIAGGLAGVRWGWEGIPAAWRHGMRGRGVATPLVDRLVGTTGARLGITFLPGKKHDGWTGDHWRDLGADAARLRELGVGTLLLLVEDVELDDCQVPDLPAVLPAAGVELVRFPIRDPRTPTDHAAFARPIRDMVERLRAGAFVAIACHGGLDRSGMAAACVLIEAGLTRPAAIDRVHSARKGSLTYRDQLDFPRDSWGEGRMSL